jgi:hypothetical protein
MKPKTKCNVFDCEKPAYAKGYCQKHYNRFHKYGSPYTTHTGGRNRRPDKFCLTCKMPFHPSDGRHDYCSHKCAYIALSKKGRVDHTEAKSLRNSGMTCAAIGAVYGVSRQRIHQILQNRP